MSTVSAYYNRSFTLTQSLAWIGLAIAILLLGAHFYRAGEYGLGLATAGILAFLCMPSGWKHYAVAFFLMWAMLEWGESALHLAISRIRFGMPWMRGTAILVAVGLVTGSAGCYAFLRARKLDEGSASDKALFQGVVFISVFMLLLYLRRMANLDFLLLERYLPLIGSVQIFFVSWYAAFISGKLLDPQKSRRTRRTVWAVFAVVFFTQFFLGLAGHEKMLLTGKLHVPIPGFILYAPAYRFSFSVMPVIVLAATLLAGTAWCSMLCYFGPLDAVFAGNKPVKETTKRMELLMRHGRVIVLATGVLAAWGLRASGLETGTAVWLALVFAALSLTVMAVWSRGYGVMAHCTTFCPLGFVVGLLGRLSPWRVRVDRRRCDDCGACEKVCRYKAVSGESRREGLVHSRCTLCRDCMGVCKKQALYLYFPGLDRAVAWKIFTGLVVTLHVLFLSVAMV